jgi:hypothetical protein
MRQFVSGTRPMTTPDVIAAPFISHATASPVVACCHIKSGMSSPSMS